MPVSIIESSKVRPSFVAKPDLRYATTFISNKYRDYAVNGEALMDKTTGELFIKRPEDGRVISFFQNRKFLDDLSLNFLVMKNNHIDFKYPDVNNLDALYVSTDYDLMSINDEKPNDIMENNTVIPNTNDTTIHQFKIRLSKDTNGFFCRLTSRDSDKAVIQWYDRFYNSFLLDYDGTEQTILDEKKVLSDYPEWVNNDVIVHYDVTAYRENNNSSETYECEGFLHVNVEGMLKLPIDKIKVDFSKGYDYVVVTIKEFIYRKIHFVNNMISTFGEAITNERDRFICPDKKIYINYCNVVGFVDHSKQILLNGNEFIVAMMDIPSLSTYIEKMSRIYGPGDNILTSNRPGVDKWRTDTIWLEHVREVGNGGAVINQDCEIDLKTLENWIAGNKTLSLTNFVSDSYKDGMLLTDANKFMYTKEEFDTKIQGLYDYVMKKADNKVTEEEKSDNDSGLILETVSVDEGGTE